MIPVTDINDKLLLALPDEWFMQLWAEAYIWWQQDPQGFRLSRSERQHLNELNRNHREALALEDDIRQALDYDLPLEQWGEFGASELGRRLWSFQYDPRDSIKVGRVLAKLEMEDSRITIRTLHGRRIYRLPLMISPAVPTYST